MKKLSNSDGAPNDMVGAKKIHSDLNEIKEINEWNNITSWLHFLE
jgi:hypothetical protein